MNIPFFRGIKAALSLFYKGEWREINSRLRLYVSLFYKRDWREINSRLRLLLGQIDLKNIYVDELNLSTERSHYYSDSGGPELEKILATFNITPHDAIIDFGCGKGGALITLAKFPFSKVTGVEISAELVDIARENLRKLWIDNVYIVCCDATEFTDLDEYNYVYFFNPFPCTIMQSVVENLKKSLDRNYRNVTIIYLNPACHDVIVADSPFVKQNEFDHPTLRYYIYSNISKTSVTGGKGF